MTTKKLRQQIKTLQKELDKRIDEDNEEYKSKTTYLKPVRNVQKFSGNEDKDDIHVDDWIEEVEHVIKSHRMNREESTDFIYSNLTGLAKEEIKYRPYEERSNPTKVLRILSETFGDKEGITVLQRNFFERKQMEGESLREYSYALMNLIKKITTKNTDIIPNPDLTLCEQFAQNVNDISLRRELKRLIRQQPDIHFLDFRDEAILFSEDEEKNRSKCSTDRHTTEKQAAESSQKSEKTTHGIDKYLEVIQRQEQNIDNLTKLLERQTVSKSKEQYRVPYPQLNRRRCYTCKSENHIQRNCPRNLTSANYQQSGK
nr:uncharacterized protein LOC117692829 [Crassostrea gigas]